MTLSRNLFALSGVALAISATQVQAQSPVSEQEKLIITANRQLQQIAEIPGSVHVIEQEEIARQAAAGKDLRALLAQKLPSLGVSSETRTNAGQLMRGRSVQVMIDGVSLNSSRNISRQLESIDLDNIERIESISGATSIYGASASGGIINIITKKGGGAEPSIELHGGFSSSLQGGDDLSKQLGAAISGSQGRLDYRLSLELEQSGQFYSANGQRVLPDITQISSDYSDQHDLMLQTGFELDENQRLGLTLQHFSNEQDSDRAAYLGTNLANLRGAVPAEPVAGLALQNQPKTDRNLVNFTYTHEDLADQRLDVQVSHRSETIRFFPFPVISSYMAYTASEQATDVTSLKATLQKDLPSLDADLVYGLDMEQESFSAKARHFNVANAFASGGLVFKETGEVGRYPDVDTDSAAIFAQLNWHASERVTLKGGLRYQHIWQQVGDFVGYDQQNQIHLGSLARADAVPGGKTDYGALLGNIGVVYQLTPEQELYANLSQGFELPDASKYYGQGLYSGGTLLKGVSVSDSRLDAITTNSLELGWRLAKGDFDGQAALYYSESDKTVDINKSTFLINLLDQKKRIYGLELSGRYQFTPNWSAGGSYHHSVGETETAGGWKALGKLEAQPDKLVTWVGYEQGDLYLQLQSQTLFDYDEGFKDGQSSRAYEGYTLVDLLGTYQLGKGTLGFGVSNLLNEDYVTLWSQQAQDLYGSLASPTAFTFKGRGRSYALNYSVKF